MLQGASDTGSRSRAVRVLSRVPEVSLSFWVVTALATTVGETAADDLDGRLGFGLTGTTVCMTVVLVVALGFQLRARRYVPGIFWVSVVLLSAAGTLLTDDVVDGLGVSLRVCAALFGVLLLATFGAWQCSEGTVSQHSITSTRREAFYWTTVLFGFALGTAAGGLIAEELDIGAGNSVILLVAVLTLIAVAFRFVGLHATAAFWTAYVLTRPLGASLGELVSEPRDDGGFGLGATATACVFLTAILAVVLYMTSVQKRQAVALHRVT